MEETKICKQCGKEKESSEFHKKSSSKDGISSICKECAAEYHKLKQQANKERNKNKEIISEVKVCSSCKEEKVISKFSKNCTTKDGVAVICKDCASNTNKEYKTKNREKIKTIPETKICTKCNIKKTADQFYNNATNKDGLFNECIDCCKEYYNEHKDKRLESYKKYREEHKEEKSLRDKKYREENKEKLKSKQKIWYEKNKDKVKQNHIDNKDRIKERMTEYRKEKEEVITKQVRENSFKVAKYSIYGNRLTIVESPVCNGDDELWCKCTYCDEYFPVTNSQIRNRIGSLNGRNNGEHRLYCCDEHKNLCPIFGQVKYPKGFKANNESRCNQQRVRQILLDLQMDEFGYTYCEKCGEPFPPEELYFHHNVPIDDDPNEYDNAAHYMVVCRSHHTHNGCLGKAA